MQINRLFSIVYRLLGKKIIPAKELAECFEVSLRTIYRDIDTLSAAGIPIYARKGKGGGVSLMDHFILDKSVFSEQEQQEILMSLQSLDAFKASDSKSVLAKVSIFFNKQPINWIDIDFSRWNSSDREPLHFSLIKKGILTQTTLTFDYFSSYGEKTNRTVEPLKLLFKGQSWYLYGFCRLKSDFRVFKITRIKNLYSLEEPFTRQCPNHAKNTAKDTHLKMTTLVLRVEAQMAYRLYDEFDPEAIMKNVDGSFTATATFPEDEWVYGYVMSYGNYAEILEPQHMRERIKRKYEEGLKKYATDNQVSL